MPFKLLFLFFVTVFIDKLYDAHWYNLVDQGVHFLVCLNHIIYLQYLLKHSKRFVQSHHIKIKLVSLVFRFKQIDLVRVFKSDVKIFLWTMWNWHINFVQKGLEKLISPLTSVWIRNGHQYVTGRGAIATTKVKIVQRLENTELSSVWLSRLDYLFKKFNLLFHLEGIYHLECLIFGDNV